MIASTPEPFYTPWVGDDFKNRPQRLLILGESHYGEYAKTGDATIKMTEEYLSGDINYAFWTNIQNVVSPVPLIKSERAAFWQSVAFYNYVQESAGPTAGIAPSDTAFKNSKGAFFTVLDRLKPHVILVLSTRLWENLPGSADGAVQAAPLVVAGKERDAWTYKYAGGSALASWVTHLSLYFSVNRWRPWVKALIDRTSQ
jgi:hypothetical protein